MSEKNNFVIRAYQPGDEDGINDMFNEVFTQQRDLRAWQWEFAGSPYGPGVISVGISEEGRPASHFSGYPAILCCTGTEAGGLQEFRTLQCADKMTRQQFRKSGLMSGTYEHFRQQVAEKQIPFSYAFAAAASFRLGNRLGYADIGPVHYRKLVISQFSLRFTDTLAGAVRGLSIHEVSSIDREWSSFFDKAARGYECLIKKDEAYFRWRYLVRPNRRYFILAAKEWGKLIGWAVFFREGDKLIWGDALYCEGKSSAVMKTLKHLLGHPYAAGAAYIECWFPPRPDWWHATLRRTGFSEEAEPNGLHLVAPTWHDKDFPELLKQKFYYTVGDSDLF
ncbi:MAG: hypothetical protein C0402_06330 [Thermodesulfovibrio sp.]|nr:hypothetical protein [Thermodesulfovibrio sp.]